jgi:hypothetical protein
MGGAPPPHAPMWGGSLRPQRALPPRAPPGEVGSIPTACAGASASRHFVPAPRTPPSEEPARAPPTPPRARGSRPWTPSPTAFPYRHARRRMPLGAESGSCCTHSTPAPAIPLPDLFASAFCRGCRAAGAELGTQHPDLGGWHAAMAPSALVAVGFGGFQRGRGPLWRGRGGKRPHKGAHRAGGTGRGQRPERVWRRQRPAWARARLQGYSHPRARRALRRTVASAFCASWTRASRPRWSAQACPSS